MNRDERSVGELLLDADFQARTLLLDVVGDDAPALLRTWGEVVQSAGELWAGLPQLSASPADGATMQRLETMARGMHRHQLARDWPGSGELDQRLLGIAENFVRATELVDGRDHARDTWPPAVRADVDAVKMRVMHTLYVAAHGVGVAVQQHIQDTEDRFGSKPSLINRAITRGRDAAAQLVAFEQLAGAHVGTRFAQVMRGEHRHAVGAGRLHQAMAAWDVQAHRAIAAAPTATHLHLVARTQAFLSAATAHLLDAAVQSQHLETGSFQQQLRPALESTHTSWSLIARRCEQLADRRDRPDATLVRAAGELRAAITEVGYDKTAWASPSTIASRVDLDDTVATLHQGIAAAVEAAVMTRDAFNDKRMSGSARGIADWQHEFLETATTNGVPAPVASWVDAGDIAHGRRVPLSRAVRAALDDLAEAVTDDTRRTMAAASGIRQTVTMATASATPTRDKAPTPWVQPVGPQRGPTL
ncbi:hypothetical protein [Flexivirga caeni]|uniref:hypothetical protein n=1 Tax=Flexivirga caeni TaxID=2294115 RepID=UPI0013157436|nr:hypothetical protein [Flexivirga caeni]